MDLAEQRRGRLLVWVALGAVIAFLISLALFRYRGTFLFAIFLYYATRPLYRKLDQVSSHPNVTTTVTILTVVIPMLAVVAYTGLLALRELDQFLAASSFAAYRSWLEPYLSLVQRGNLGQLWDILVTNPEEPVSPALRGVLPGVLGKLQSVAQLAFAISARFFLMTVVLYYLLRDGHKLRDWFYRSIDHDERFVSYVEAVDDDLEVIFVSNLAIVIVAAAVAAASFFAMNLLAPGGTVVEVPLLLSLLIGIGTLIPVVGMKIAYVPYTLYLFVMTFTTPTPLWHPVVFLAVTFTIVDTIPDFFARAFLSSRSGIHMGLVLLGYVLGTMVFGWYGLFLGPVVVVFATHFAKKVFPELASQLLGT